MLNDYPGLLNCFLLDLIRFRFLLSGRCL